MKYERIFLVPYAYHGNRTLRYMLAKVFEHYFSWLVIVLNSSAHNKARFILITLQYQGVGV